MKIWKPDEIRDLRSLYSSTEDEVLAERFATTIEEVARKAGQLALAKNKASFKKVRMPRWTPEDIQILRDLYPTTPNLEIAKRLNRSQKSVNSKAHQMGLRKSHDRLRAMGGENVRLRRDRQSLDD